MKLATALPLLLAGITTALPSSTGLNQIRFPVPDGMTIEQGSSKCGDQAQLSCCNEADYAGDTTKVADGIAAGLLSNLIGGGSGADGLGLFSQCSKLNVRLLISPGDILNRKCKQNIVCCAKSEHSASNDLVGASLPCIALGSLV